VSIAGGGKRKGGRMEGEDGRGDEMREGGMGRGGEEGNTSPPTNNSLIRPRQPCS